MATLRPSFSIGYRKGPPTRDIEAGIGLLVSLDTEEEGVYDKHILIVTTQGKKQKTTTRPSHASITGLQP